MLLSNKGARHSSLRRLHASEMHSNLQWQGGALPPPLPLPHGPVLIAPLAEVSSATSPFLVSVVMLARCMCRMGRCIDRSIVRFGAAKCC